MSTERNRLNWPFAAVWALVSFTVWLAAAVEPQDSNLTYGLVVLASFAQFVTIAVRMRLICRPLSLEPEVGQPLLSHPTLAESAQAATASHTELIWALCWLSQIYWLGTLWMGTDIQATIALASGSLLAEALLFQYSPVGWRDLLPPQLFPYATEISISQVAIEHSPNPVGTQATNGQDDGTRDDAISAAEFDQSDGEASMEECESLSATYHGLAEDGSAYVRGWLSYDMAAGQKSLPLTLGFFPPFLMPPECELDHEGDTEVSYEIEHLTPAGARILLKRRMANQPTTGRLHWHCQGSKQIS